MVASRQHYCGSRATYLSDRQQCVNIAGTLSDTKVLRSGVPQGSILGATLLLLFINDLPLTWKNKNGLFADDATFYASASTLTNVQVQLQWDLPNKYSDMDQRSWHGCPSGKDKIHDNKYWYSTKAVPL